MTGLVLELQADALNPNVRVADLLRKALVVSRKLELTDIQEWIESELGGYKSTKNCPAYRMTYGELKMWNPYRGWLPVLIGDEELAEIICSRTSVQSVGELEDLLRGDSNVFHMQFSGSQKATIAQMVGMDFEPTLHVARQSMVKVLDGVRNQILEWSLDLEKRNILGTGLTFSREEKAMANQTNYNTINNIGSMTGSQIQQHSTGQQSMQVDTQALKAFADSVDAALQQMKLSSEAQQELVAEIETLRAQVGSPRPKSNVIRSCLGSVKEILEGAAGNVLASGLLAQLAPLLGPLGS